MCKNCSLIILKIQNHLDTRKMLFDNFGEPYYSHILSKQDLKSLVESGNGTLESRTQVMYGWELLRTI